MFEHQKDKVHQHFVARQLVQQTTVCVVQSKKPTKNPDAVIPYSSETQLVCVEQKKISKIT